MPISNGQLAWTNRYFHAPEEAQTAVEVEIPPKDPANPYDVKLSPKKKKKPKPQKPTQTKVKPFVAPPAGPGTPPGDASRDNDDHDDDDDDEEKKKRRRRLLAIILGVLAGLLLLAAIIIILCFTGVICGNDKELPPVPGYLANALSGSGPGDQCMGEWTTHYMVYNFTHTRCVIDVDTNNQTSFGSVSDNGNVALPNETLRCCYNRTQSIMVPAGKGRSYDVPSGPIIIPHAGTPDYPITCPQFCIDPSLTECCDRFGPEVCHKYNPGLCTAHYPPWPPGYNPNSAPSLGSTSGLLSFAVGLSFLALNLDLAA